LSTKTLDIENYLHIASTQVAPSKKVCKPCVLKVEKPLENKYTSEKSTKDMCTFEKQ
jgi:hypothetical protein